MALVIGIDIGIIDKRNRIHRVVFTGNDGHLAFDFAVTWEVEAMIIDGSKANDRDIVFGVRGMGRE